MNDNSAGLVVDFTPGSGALARACFDSGIQYAGVCRTDEHALWLVKFLNRAAVASIVKPANHLHEPGLAKGLKDQFMEVIDEVNALDQAISEDEREWDMS